MIKKFLGLFKDTELKDALNQTKKIKIQGVLFHIRKINPLDYLNGSQTVLQVYSEYQKTKSDAVFTKNFGKVKDHYRDVILAGVVKPKLKRKKEDEGVDVEDLFTNWEMAETLFSEIMTYTYGKKKLIQSTYPEKG